MVERLLLYNLEPIGARLRLAPGLSENDLDAAELLVFTGLLTDRFARVCRLLLRASSLL